MKTHEFKECLEIARSAEDLSDHDDSILYGCGLPGFPKVTVTKEAFARFLRWQVVQFNGGIDAAELDNCANIARRKVNLV